MGFTDTIAAIATAAGRGGVGIVRLSGEKAWRIAEQLTHTTLPAPHHAALRHFYLPYSGTRPVSTLSAETGTPITNSPKDPAQKIDTGLLILFPKGASYTGEAVAECQIHGSPLALSMLLEAAIHWGARLANAGEFTQRAYLNGQLDLTQAESVADLIDAESRHAVLSATQSLSGAFSKKINALAQMMIETRALLEAGLDFADEDIDFIEHSELTTRLHNLQDHLQSLIQSAKEGVFLRDGVKCVLAGAPNVGKSSLLNALSGEEAAIVTDIPGTTRDTISRTVVIKGIPFHFMDTAGLRNTTDPLEKLGIARSLEALKTADMVLWLGAVKPDGDIEMEQTMLADITAIGFDKGNLPIVSVINKCDLATSEKSNLTLMNLSGIAPLIISAKTGEGMNTLRDYLCKAVGANINVSQESSPFIARTRHLIALQEAVSHIHTAHSLVSPPPFIEEMVAEELRLSHQCLQKITGEYHSDDLLGEIFGRFCIGK